MTVGRRIGAAGSDPGGPCHVPVVAQRVVAMVSFSQGTNCDTSV